MQPGLPTADANTERGPARVLLVEDHQMFAQLLARLIGEQPDLDIVGIAADADDAQRCVRVERPSIVIIDYRLPGADGVVLAQRLRADFPDVGLVLLTGQDDDTVLRAALAAGCAGFLSKDAPTEDLLRVVRAVRDGLPALGPELIARLASPVPVAARRTGLTERELEVLTLLVEGASTQMIASRLFISLNTARNHVQRVLRKLAAHSRLEAVAIATRDGLVPQRGRGAA